MTAFLALWHSPMTALLFVAGFAIYIFHRLGNQKVTLSWESKTVAEEPAKGDIKTLTKERDEYKNAADHLKKVAEGRE